MTDAAERWLDVPGYEGYYQVSDLGRVRSLDRVVPHARSLRQTSRGRVMCTPLDRKGYPRLLLKKDGAYKSWAVHRLVMCAFEPRADTASLHVNHKDGDRARSVLTNLEWCTASENRLHSYRVLGRLPPGTGRFGAAHHNARAVVGTCIATGASKQYASRSLTAADGFRPPDVSACARGAQKTHRGFAWKFAAQEAA